MGAEVRRSADVPDHRPYKASGSQAPALRRALAERYSSFRAAVGDEARKQAWMTQFMRPGFMLIALFEIACISTGMVLHPAPARQWLPFQVFNAVAAFVCLSLMYTLWFEQHWRATAFGFCFWILLAASYLSLSTGRTEPLFVSAMLLLFGAGSLVPWNARWQSALTLLCLAGLAVNAIWLPTGEQDGLYRWLGLLAAAGLAQIGPTLNARRREQFESQASAIADHPEARDGRAMPRFQ